MSKQFYFFFILSFGYFFPPIASAQDSLSIQPYLQAADSVFITVGSLREKYILHRLQEKQTIYSLARFYGLRASDIYDYNPLLSPDQVIPLYQEIKVPIPNRAILRYPTSFYQENQFANLYYRVKEKETLYKIAKRYFDMPVDSIKRRNNLVHNVIYKDQVLHVGWIDINGVPDSLQGKYSNPLYKKSILLRGVFEQIEGKIYIEKGSGQWFKGMDVDQGLYVLHKKARIGDVVAVTNLMNKRTLYAKVIARLPTSKYPSGTAVVLSPQLAYLLGAQDSKFYVEVRYKK